MSQPLSRGLQREAIAKRRDEALVRLAAELGLFVPGRLIGALAALDADPRPDHGGKSSYQVVVDMRVAMDRDGLALLKAQGWIR